MEITNKGNTRIIYISYLAAILLFLEMMPYFWWWTQSFKYVNYACRLLLCSIFWAHFYTHKKSSLGLITLFILTCFLFAIRGTIASLVLTIPLLFIPFASGSFIQNVFRAFTNVYCIITGIALVSWILLLVGFNNPIGTIAPLNANDFDYYTVYPLFLVTNNFFDIQNAFRFSGPFDEAGMVGTFSALLLFANSFNFKNWKTYVFLLSGIASFSLFFYVVLIIGLLPKLFSKRSFGGVIIVILAISLFYNITKENEAVGVLIWDRLEWDSSEKNFVGDNRTNDDAKKFYETRRWTSDYWFGLDDYEPYRIKARGSNSYQNVVMQYGMLFLMSYVIFFVLYAWSGERNKYSFIIFVVLFFSCIYQRPQVFSSAYLFAYVCLARYETLKTSLENNNNNRKKNVLNSSNDSYIQAS